MAPKKPGRSAPKGEKQLYKSMARRFLNRVRKLILAGGIHPALPIRSSFRGSQTDRSL